MGEIDTNQTDKPIFSTLKAMTYHQSGTRPRVLIIAEAANPELVSVPLVGWSLVKALSEIADIHLVTQIRNRDAICRAGWKEHKDFTAIDSEKIAAPAYRLGELLPGGWTTKMAVTAISYRYFEKLVWNTFKEDLRAGKWDLVHRITPLSPTVPSTICQRLKGLSIPFIIGPLNGGLPWPKQFNKARREEREWLSYLRSTYRLLPGYRSTLKYASAILCGSQATLSQMPSWAKNKCTYLPENGIDPSRFSQKIERPVKLPLKIAFVGRLVPYKCPDILLEASVDFIRKGKINLDFIGDGPLRSSLEARTKSLGISENVRIDGWVPHEKLQERLIESDIFGFPSVREFGGAVVMEAMALGLVPIVVDYGGPGEIVKEGYGFKLPMTRREEMVRAMRSTLEHLVAHPENVRAIGLKCAEFSKRNFTWEKKAQSICDVYVQVHNYAKKELFSMEN